MLKKEKQELSTKEFFIRYGVFVAFLVILLGILIYPIKKGQKTWNTNLKVSVQKVLDENFPGVWNTEEAIPVKTVRSLSTACYKISNNNSGEEAYGVITRAPTLYGPIPVVFICTTDKQVTFAGYSSIHGKMIKQLQANKVDLKLKFLGERIPGMIGL